MIHILKFAFKGTFASFDDAHAMARSTFCRADPAMENDGLDSNVPIWLCVSGKYDLARKTGLILSIPHLQYIFGLLTLENSVLPLYNVILSKHWIP